MFTRSYAVDDITIRSGTGRTVEAYAAVFDVEAEIKDRQGHYLERIARRAFDASLAKGRTPAVIYHHGMTLQGTPSESGSLPIGRAVEVKADSRGLLTVTEYANTARADELLELIRVGAITAQSFAGKFTTSSPQRSNYQPDRNGTLPTVTRTGIELREYGPTPFPAYKDAAIIGVRSIHDTPQPSAELRWLRHKYGARRD